MDEVSDQSPLLTVILLWDKVQYVLDDHPWFLSQCSLLITCLYLFGTRTDLFYVVCFFLRFNFTYLLQSLFSIVTTWHGKVIVAIGAIIALDFRLDLVRRIFQEPEATCSSVATPYLIPSRTTHTRLFPKKHSFSYSYLLAGIPIDFHGNVNGILSAPSSSNSMLRRRAWFYVEPADYLERGLQHLGLRAKLDNYLKSQGVDLLLYPHAYLITAPGFLGYHFNPVSFWYLYNTDKVLSAIVAEFNNTFGERRPYLFVRDLTVENSPRDGVELTAPDGPRTNFSSTMKKDFHVSPFNSRHGSYSLLASDPLGENMKGFRGVDVTINLVSSQGQPKIVARLFSQGNAIDPATMSPIDRARFLLRWFWVGFATFPRFVKEAGVLFFKRKLHVWYRPEPLKDTLARHADRTERDLETIFRMYLRHLVENSTFPVAVKYIPSGLASSEVETFTSAAAGRETADPQQTELRILTPVFYSRFAGYAHDFEAIFCEMAESCTVWASQPDVLPKIFFKKASPPLHATTLSNFLAFKAIHRLRMRPAGIKRPLTSADTVVGHPPNTRVTDIREFRMSSMDAFVLNQPDPDITSMYKFALIRLFIVDRLGLGSVELLDWIEFTVRLIAARFLAGLFQAAIEIVKDPLQ